MTARAGVTVGGDVSVSPQVTCMNLSGSSSAPVARLTLTTEFALGAKRVHGRNANAPHENFLTDARWSPDGVCLLTAGAEDGTFRVYDVPGELPALRGGVGDAGGEKFDDEMNDANETFENENNGDTNDRLPPDSLWPALRIKAGEAVRDYDWWPKMDAHADTATCLFASACKAQPVHVWDAISGKIKASYCGRNALDEPVDFNVVCFASGAEKIFAGRNNEIRTWDVTRPGYSGDLLWRGGKGGVSFGGSFGGSFGNKNGSSFGNKNAYSSVASTENTFFKGLVTALQSAPLTSTAASSSQVLAAGCAGGIINLFHAQTGEQTVSFTGHADAITRLKWSPCGTFLYSAARRGTSFCVSQIIDDNHIHHKCPVLPKLVTVQTDYPDCCPYIVQYIAIYILRLNTDTFLAKRQRRPDFVLGYAEFGGRRGIYHETKLKCHEPENRLRRGT